MLVIKSVSKLVSKAITYTIIAFSLSACLSTTSQVGNNDNNNQTITPDWVVNLPQSNDTIYGVGSSTIYASEGIAIEAANESARLELAKSIRVEVKGTTQVNRISDNGNLSFYFNEAIKNSVPKMELTGLKIIDRFIDNKTSTVFVLASFNKAQAINELHQFIDSLDAELTMMKIGFSKPIGEKLSQAIAVKTLLLQRSKYNQQLVNLRQHKVFIDQDTRRLITDVNRVLNEITFAVVGDNLGANNSELQSKLIEAITQQGLRVNNKTADFKISYQVKWRDLNRGDTFYSIMTASISLMAGDTILKSFNQKAKGTSSDQVLARGKATDKLAEQFSVILAKELLLSFEHSGLDKY